MHSGRHAPVEPDRHRRRARCKAHKPPYIVELRQLGIDHNGEYVDVYANGSLCGRFSFTDPKQQTVNGEAEFALAQESQPPACGTDGATITLIDGRGLQLVETYTLKLGTRIEIVHLSIPPVVDPGPLPPNAGSGVTVDASYGSMELLGAALVIAACAAGAGAVASRRTVDR